jgi:hypothetical protein
MRISSPLPTAAAAFIQSSNSSLANQVGVPSLSPRGEKVGDAEWNGMEGKIQKHDGMRNRTLG